MIICCSSSGELRLGLEDMAPLMLRVGEEATPSELEKACGASVSGVETAVTLHETCELYSCSFACRQCNVHLEACNYARV